MKINLKGFEKMYYINYYTGAGDFEIDGTIEDAMTAADKGARYTQQDIEIKDSNNKTVAARNWCGVEYDTNSQPEEDNPIVFGSMGYYGDWWTF